MLERLATSGFHFWAMLRQALRCVVASMPPLSATSLKMV
jgi:hypothetical protein